MNLITREKEMKEVVPASKVAIELNSRIKEICGDLLKNHPGAERWREWLKKLKVKIDKEDGLGWLPWDRKWLVQRVQEDGYSSKQMIESGFFGCGDDGLSDLWTRGAGLMLLDETYEPRETVVIRP